MNLDETWFTTHALDLLKHAKFVSHGLYLRELFLSGFLKNTFNVGLHSDAYKMIQHGVMLDMTMLYSVIPV